MVSHIVEFEYFLPEEGSEQMDIDPNLDEKEKEQFALIELEEMYPDIENINIIKIKVLS